MTLTKNIRGLLKESPLDNPITFYRAFTAAERAQQDEILYCLNRSTG